MQTGRPLKEAAMPLVMEQRAANDAPGGTPPPAEPGKSHSGGGLVKISFNVTPRALAALDRAVIAGGDNRTDTINRALVAYSLLLDLAEAGGGSLTLLNQNGDKERLHLL
jgi:hypothetical protein